MKRFIITSPKFTGEINVLYGLDDKLQFIDFMKCDLTEEQITFFKTKLPVFYTESFKDAFGTSRLDVVEHGYKVSFEQWWDKYDLKRNRERCLKLWKNLSEADQVNAFFKLGMYERYLMLQQWRTKAEPDTYLRKRYWDNDWSKN
jgi:hypothetical protein